MFDSAFWRLLPWIVCGGLVAVMFIGVMSIGPYVIPAIFAFVLVAILGSTWNQPFAFYNLGAMTVSALVFFALLLIHITHVGVEWVDLPAESKIMRQFPKIEYSDAFRVTIVGKQHDIEIVARALMASMSPGWTGSHLRSKLESVAFEEGPLLSGWEVFSKNTDEIIIGLNRSHIDLRISIFLKNDNGNQLITASTIARYNNWVGLVYFLPVRFGHQIVLADTMRKVKHSLQ